MLVPFEMIAIQMSAAVRVDGNFELRRFCAFAENFGYRLVERPFLLLLRRHFNGLGNFKAGGRRKGRNNMFERKRVDSSDEKVVALYDAKGSQPTAQLTCTLIAVGDAGNAPWRPHVFRQHPS